ncbi:mechanosensitive ion channel domain-containing protein [Bosea sp. (in: a-proteobacteria)]|uniref:mechanosensitive ion channel domain-containing protein n=1 Tax=Bosea sp. (in: a-proteobacteria) TaxID=1871050 RepID=UPI002FCABAB3
MQSGPSVPATPPVSGAAMVSPLDGLASLLVRVEAEVLVALGAAPGLPGELGRLLSGTVPALPVFAEALSVGAAVLAVYLLVRHLLRHRRQRAGAARSAFAGIVTLAAFDLLALLAAAVTGRLLLVRWLGIAPGTQGFPSELTIGLIRWLMLLTLLLVLFQPRIRRLRLSAVDDAGARKAVRHFAAIFAVGHLHVVLLNAAQRAGLGLPSLRLLSWLVALGMAVAALRLLRDLKRHDLPRATRLLASGIVLVLLAFWVWGWVELDFNLYRGAVGMIVILLLAVALDRALGISIRDSRSPAAMRRLFVVRVVVDALALALMVRIVIQFWWRDVFGGFGPQQWLGFTHRLTFASFVLVLAVALSAAIHAWTEAKLTPGENGPEPQLREDRLARLSTVLPLVRFMAIALIGVAFSLVALSTLGIDTTPLLAGASIVGLAISFGSQTLVKDIVSGIFYMLDDVFRLGETIEAGGRTGQLEQINLRSVRLRDEAGRVHTIPLGDLGAVTNHSRRLMRVTAKVPFATPPGQAAATRFRRNAVAALRSEPMIHAAIVGEIAATRTEAQDTGGGAIVFSFNMVAGAAERARALVQRRIEETLAEARMTGAPGAVDVAVADLPGAPPAAPPPATPEPTP